MDPLPDMAPLVRAPVLGDTGEGVPRVGDVHDRILALLDYWQKVVEGNEDTLRSSLNISATEELSVKMIRFGSEECWLYAPAQNRTIHLTAKQAGTTSSPSFADSKELT